MRLDVYLVQLGMAPSRSRAQEWIEGGFIRVGEAIVTKPAYSIDETNAPPVAQLGTPHPYVGRGGVKLAHALTHFSVDVSDKICADIGASTGGFTDCLLQRGAAFVYAVDSGSDQLDPRLRADSRVCSMEHCNARYLTADSFGRLCDIAVADLSFISQTLVLPSISAVLSERGLYIGLIKPQFECGAAALDRHGIVKLPRNHAEAIRRVRDAAAALGLPMRAITQSPIRGGDGNREFLCFCDKTYRGPLLSDSDIDRLVRA